MYLGELTLICVRIYGIPLIRNHSSRDLTNSFEDMIKKDDVYINNCQSNAAKIPYIGKFSR